MYGGCLMLLSFLQIFLRLAEIAVFIFLVIEHRRGFKILMSLAVLTMVMAGTIICDLLLTESQPLLWDMILFLPFFALLVYKTMRLGKIKSNENFRFKSAMVL